VQRGISDGSTAARVANAQNVTGGISSSARSSSWRGDASACGSVTGGVAAYQANAQIASPSRSSTATLLYQSASKSAKAYQLWRQISKKASAIWRQCIEEETVSVMWRQSK